jgi:rhodanese-related sulfurtransferase
MIEQLSAEQLKAKFDAGEKFVLVDVRQANELDICKITGAVHIPLHELTQRAGELDQGAEIVLQCHHGGRSQRAAEYLASQGFKNLANLAGGIEDWAAKIDPNMARY